MSKLSKFLQVVLQVAAMFLSMFLSIYLVTMPFASCYYAWKDIKSHDSFGRSIFISPIVGMLKSTHWPYYAFISESSNRVSSKFTIQQWLSSESFFICYTYLHESSILDRDIKSSNDPPKDLEHIKSLTNAAISRSAKIDCSILDSMYPGWGMITSEKLIPGFIKLRDGLAPGGDRADISRATALFADFDTWMRSNWDSLKLKASE